MDFEWDDNKNSVNNEKHGFDFNMAKLVFLDENRVTFHVIILKYLFCHMEHLRI